ncbi:MAG: hypothetical protein GC136_05695 [Alphaproteobacteria bacterium]|nr:hypothetical protein [Alphaproteobacteria bacterium]
MAATQTWQPEAPIPVNAEGARAVRIESLGDEFARFASDKMVEVSFLPSRLRELFILLTVGDEHTKAHYANPDAFPKRADYGDDQALGRVYIANLAAQLLKEKLGAHPNYQAGDRVAVQFNVNDGSVAKTFTING